MILFGNRLVKSGERRPASTPDFHGRHHLYHSKRVNPPEVTINNELKRANAMYIGQQFQVMRTFMSTCEFHTAVTQGERRGTRDDGTKSTQSPGFAYMFIFISYLLYSWYTGQQSILPPWNSNGLSKSFFFFLRMLALKLLKKCSENSSKERGKGNSACAYLHSRIHTAYAAL